MEIFWNTIASYNAATWPVQILLTLVAATLTLLLYLRPTPGVRIAMKTFMALLNFWIAGVYYLLYGEQREHKDMLALFWAIMGCIWVYDLVVKHASLQRTHNHTGFALLLFAMPLVYPLFSLALGRTVPDGHHARDAVFGRRIHHRADAGLFGADQHRAGHVPLPLGADRALEGLLLRHPRGLPPGMQHRAGTLHLLPRIYPQ